MRRAAWALAVAATLGACQEQLTVPVGCPGLCPGNGMVIRDTVLEADFGRDSSFAGYIGFNDVGGMILTNGSAAGTAHAIVTFAGPPETFEFGGVNYEYRVDSVLISLGVIGRDTLIAPPRLLLYRVPANLDSTTTITELESHFTPQNLIDTLRIADTLHVGYVNLRLRGDGLAKLATLPADSGRLGFGVALDGDRPTGVRLGSRLTAGFGPTIINYITLESEDTTILRQFIAPHVRYSASVRNTEPVSDPDLLVVGGTPTRRSILRFTLPPAIEQSATVLRATLEMTPARPHYDLAFDASWLDVRLAVVDLGFRSIPVPAGAGIAQLPREGLAVVQVEVTSILNTWRTQPRVPRLLYLSITPEGQAYAEPVFHSTRSSPTGRPRLRITYAVPGRLEAP